MVGIFQDSSHVSDRKARDPALLCCMPRVCGCGDPPPLLADQAYSKNHGSVEAEMIARASHNHALYNLDCRDVFDRLERATRGNAIYSGTITAFRCTKNGRGAYLAYQSQHAGRNVWEAMIKRSEFFMQNTQWTGNTSIKFIAHSSKHRQSYIEMTEASKHVAVECPNEHSRVTYLLNSIECKDPDLLAAVAAIKQDDTGKRQHFEDAVLFIIPCCPVAAKQVKKTHFGAQVAAANGLNTTLKSGIGKTGVELRFHKHADFRALPEDQREEVKAFQAQQKKRPTNGKGGSPMPAKKRKTEVLSTVEKQGRVMKAMAATLAQTQAALSSLSLYSHPSLEAAVGAITISETTPTPSETTEKLE